MLALVTRADTNAVQFALPSGLRASAPPDELLVESSAVSVGPPVTFESHGSDSDSDASSTDGSENGASDDDDNNAPVPIYQALQMGQIVRVAVVSTSHNDAGKRVVTVSLKPDLVNAGLSASRLTRRGMPVYAAVRSVEDHGYILSFGSGIHHTGFLPFDETEGDLRPGYPIEVVVDADVLRKGNGKARPLASLVVNVSARREKVRHAKVDGSEGLSYNELKAGMLVHARMTKEGPGGVALSAFSVFKVSVDSSHVPRGPDGTWEVEIGKQVATRIYYVDPSQKRIVASLLSELVREVRPRAVPEAWRIGTLMKRLRVDRVKPGFGLMLSYVNEQQEDDDWEGDKKLEDVDGNEEEDMAKPAPDNAERHVPVFAHISRVSDSKDVKLELTYRAGMIIDQGARIIAVSRFDGQVNVDLRRSILSRKVLSVEEIELGALYNCKVISHTATGSVTVAVEGDSRLLGIIPSAHLSDVPISAKRLATHESLRMGANIRCRAIRVRTEVGKTYFSARKSVVSLKYPLLTSLEQAEKAVSAKVPQRDEEEEADVRRDSLFTAFVRKTLESGSVIVDFCGGLKGLAPVSELCIETNKSLSARQKEINELYPMGQTVHVRLTGVDAKLQRMTVSMDLRRPKQIHERGLRVGQFVKGHITSADDQAKHFNVSVNVPPEPVAKVSAGRVGDDDAVERRNSKQEAVLKRVECHLPFGHVSDVRGLGELVVKELLKALGNKKVALKILTVNELMVISVREGIPVVTCKPSLIAAAKTGTLPKSLDDVKQLIHNAGSSDGRKPIVRGYVKAVLEAGAIIGFLGNVVGFTRISRIADHFVSDPSRSLYLNQSVPAVVQEVDESKQRFSLSLRSSDVGQEGLEADTLSLFETIDRWRVTLCKESMEGCFKIGSVQNAKVHAKDTYGVVYNLSSGTKSALGVALDVGEQGSALGSDSAPLVENITLNRKQRHGKGGAEEENVKEEPIRILDVDPFSGVVDVSRSAAVVAGGQKKSILHKASVFKATILLVKSSYIILAVNRSKTRTAIAFALAPPISDKLAITPGITVQCTVLDKTAAQTNRNLAVIDWGAFRNDQLKGEHSFFPNKDEGLAHILSLLQEPKTRDASLVEGKKVSGKITRVFPLHAFVGIAPGVVGHIHKTNASALSRDEENDIPLGVVSDEVHARFSLPKEGTRVRPAYVCGIRRSSDAEEAAPLVLELSLAPERVKKTPIMYGSRLFGFVTHVSSRFSNVNSSSCGGEGYHSTTRVVVDASTSVSCVDVNCLFADPGVTLQVGSAVVCMVIEVEEKGGSRIWAALSDNGTDSEGFFSGIVQSVIPGVGLRVEIPWFARDSDAKSKSRGTVGLSDIASNFDEVVEKMKSLKQGDVVRVRKVSAAPGSSEFGCFLSMRCPGDSGTDPLLTEGVAASLVEGTKVRGFVKAVSKKGCFVTIGRDVTALVLLCDLADGYVKEPEKSFPVGMLVEGVTGKPRQHNERTHIQLVLRKRPRKKLHEPAQAADFEEGTRVTGTIKRIERYGAILELSKGVTALLHKSEVDQDRFVENTYDEWSVGQKLHSIVINVGEKGVKVGTKRCYFEAAGLDESQIDAVFQENEKSREVADEGVPQEGSVEMDVDGEAVNDGADNDGTEGISSPVDDADQTASGTEGNNGSVLIRTPTVDPQNVIPLKIGQSFDFADNDDESVTSRERPDDEQGEARNKVHDQVASKRPSKDKREMKRQREADETAIRLREESLAKNPDAPETAEDFERLLVGEPNSSVLWIRYMAFCLSLSQVDKARSVAERALDTISLEAETDRTNVWIAYMNLEAQFGASNSTYSTATDGLGLKRDAAVFRVFDRGCGRITDVKNFHLQAASALRNISPELSDEILRRAVRRFKGSKKVWIAQGQAQFTSKNVTGARRTLERALKSLEKRKHVPVISKFAQLEYKLGTPERGRTVFESLVGNFPKKLDLWNVYLDMETSQCRTAEEDSKTERTSATRTLFEKCTTLDLSSKKMKFIFKKWLNFEREFGDQQQRAAVKGKARDYVQRSAG